MTASFEQIAAALIPSRRPLESASWCGSSLSAIDSLADYSASPSPPANSSEENLGDLVRNDIFRFELRAASPAPAGSPRRHHDMLISAPKTILKPASGEATPTEAQPAAAGDSPLGKPVVKSPRPMMSSGSGNELSVMATNFGLLGRQKPATQIAAPAMSPTAKAPRGRTRTKSCFTPSHATGTWPISLRSQIFADALAQGKALGCTPTQFLCPECDSLPLMRAPSQISYLCACCGIIGEAADSDPAKSGGLDQGSSFTVPQREVTPSVSFVKPFALPDEEALQSHRRPRSATVGDEIISLTADQPSDEKLEKQDEVGASMESIIDKRPCIPWPKGRTNGRSSREEKAWMDGVRGTVFGGAASPSRRRMSVYGNSLNPGMEEDLQSTVSLGSMKGALQRQRANSRLGDPMDTSGFLSEVSGGFGGFNRLLGTRDQSMPFLAPTREDTLDGLQSPLRCSKTEGMPDWRTLAPFRSESQGEEESPLDPIRKSLLQVLTNLGTELEKTLAAESGFRNQEAIDRILRSIKLALECLGDLGGGRGNNRVSLRA